MSRTAMVRMIADRVKSADTQSEKADVLRYYEKESLFKRILSYAYNPMINFGLDDWVPRAGAGILHGMGISKFMHIPEDIFQNKFTRDESIFACNLAISHMNIDEVDLFVGIMHKDLGLGLEIETINQVWPDLIPSYPLQTPSEFTDEAFSRFEIPFVAQTMSTGLRVNIIVRGNTVEFRQSDGTLITGWERYVEQFSKLAQNGANVFDGHAVVVNETSDVIETDNQKVLAADPANIRFILWDVVRYDGFVQGYDQRIGYNWRFNGLEHMMFLAIDSNPQPCYRTPEQLVCGTLEQAHEFAKTKDLVLKSLSGTWATGPSASTLILRRSK